MNHAFRIGLGTSILVLWIGTPVFSQILNFAAVSSPASNALETNSDPVPEDRTDIKISGIYPHLTTYGSYSDGGAHTRARHDECGIGAVVPWAGKLWLVNYAPHMPRGSDHKLFSLGPDRTQPLTVHPESVGGTPAGRMIHQESNQLLIGHHLINAHGHVRTISPNDMPMRVTAIARHLRDPANMVYYIDMEGAIWEANVHNLQVQRLFEKPVPGWHAKGGYTSQGRLVVSNNGELPVGNYQHLRVGGPATNPEERGVLAEWNGETWGIVERRQYTDVTGPRGLAGGGDADEPLWAIGWDRRSLRLKVLDQGNWSTYLLPKAAYCNDASHGWYTEWPRIRAIGGNRWLLDMHGMFYDFPATFSSANSGGIAPVGSHLRYIPDFCEWNGQLVLASNDTSIQQNHLAGQPQSNMWFGSYEELEEWGPATAYGGPWMDDPVRAHQPSDPFLVAGFARRVLHVQVAQTDQAVKLKLQIDRQGDNRWTDFHELTLESNQSLSYIFPEDFSATWLRFATDRDCRATAFLHLTTDRFQEGTSPANMALFAGIATVDDHSACPVTLFPAQHNRNLQVIRQGSHESQDVGSPTVVDQNFFEFTKSRFDFVRAPTDESLRQKLATKPVFSIDAASVKIQYQNQTWRLPKGNKRFDKPFDWGWPRDLREVISERQLANIHGTFYEVPLLVNGQPPAWNWVRPIASHDKQISDFCSWNGLLVLGGVPATAESNEHIFVDHRQHLGLWFGGIDDLWKLGKPVGQGGPWLETSVETNVPSDPYLMTGYDQKSVRIDHTSDRRVTIRLEIDMTGTGKWIPYQAFEVPAGTTLTHQFPTGFSAHWIRAISDTTTTASVQFDYR